MSRRREVPKREILPDPRFADEQLSKFINAIMMHGKKAVAEKIIYGAIDQLSSKGKSEDGLDRQISLAMRWIIEAARKRNENSMTKKLAGELMDASENRGSSIKKREDTIKMAEANKAFSHFRW